MSSDSEDDCYGNVAQKLQSMKSQYSDDKIETTNLLIADVKENSEKSWRKNDTLPSDCDISQNSETAEELTLDAIIAKNSKKRASRLSKRIADAPVDITEQVHKRKRTKKNANTSLDTNITANNTQNANGTVSTVQNLIPTSVSSTVEAATTRSSGRRRGRGRGRGRRTTIPEVMANSLQDSPSTVPSSCATNAPVPSSNATNAPVPNSSTDSTPRGSNRVRARGRSRRGRGRRSWAMDYEPLMYDFMAAIAASMGMANSNPGSNNSPVYSVGNTDEYPDQCDDQPLFNTVPKQKSDVIIVENDAELDDNEELSVKVYWQSSEHVKFNIRRFQKLTPIFEHFAERESVSQDKLFFTYNDKILKSNDTPDSIKYSIVKFIDGGIINQSVSSIVKNNGKEDGIELKFQCQNVKKPFLIHILPDDNMSVAMMKCAEHLEKRLDKLKFHFDGDLISGKDTPKDLELEGGECIDVSVS